MEEINFIDECKKIIFKNIELFQILEEYDKTGKIPKFKYKKRVNFTIDEDLFRKFRRYCNTEGVKMSTLIERLISKEIKKQNV